MPEKKNNENSSENTNREEKCKENAEIGYRAAMDLTIKEESLFWSQFNALLVANSIFITAISITMDRNFLTRSSISAAAIVGIFLCFLWILLTERRNNYRIYYLLCAREIEEKYFKDTFNIYRRGEIFSRGSEVEFDMKDADGKLGKLQLPCLGRMKVLQWSYLIIAAFIAIYLFIILRNVGISYIISFFAVIIEIVMLGLFSLTRKES